MTLLYNLIFVYSLLSPIFVSADNLTVLTDKNASEIIPRFREVSSGIYRGGNPIDTEHGLAGIAALSNLGIKTVIDLQGGDYEEDPWGRWLIGKLQPGETPEMIEAEKNEVERLQMRFAHFSLGSLTPISAEEDLKIREVLRIMSDPTQQPVFVHCQHGADRTGLIVALYRVLYQGWDPAQAMAEWESLGHDDTSRIVTGDLDKYFYKTIEARNAE